MTPKSWAFGEFFDIVFGESDPLAPEDGEERQEQAQENAQDDAGNDRKIKYRMLPLNADIAGQSSHPFRSEAAPHHQSDQCRNDTDDQDEFAQIVHNSKSCAN
jgi:hypothetical protein